MTHPFVIYRNVLGQGVLPTDQVGLLSTSLFPPPEFLIISNKSPGVSAAAAQVPTLRSPMSSGTHILRTK